MTAEAIERFRGRWAFLSNFYHAPLQWDGLRYPTAEHAFNAGKSLDLAWRQRIAAAATPGEAKALGRQAAIRPGWDETVRYQVMREVLIAKYSAHPDLAGQLLSTNDAPLIEGNTWHDQHWGDCRCGRPACQSPGANHLGRMLIELRERLGSSSTT